MTLSMGILRSALAGQVLSGRLIVTAADGERFEVGDGTGPAVAIRFTDRRAPWALIHDPDLKLGELFTDGRLVIDEGEVFDLLTLVLRHETESPPFAAAIERLRTGLVFWAQRNGLAKARENVVHHYDLGDDFYALFLDPDWQYSCAFFERPDQSLAEAQAAKKRRIAAKLALKPGQSVLDIGCGWGGLGIELARDHGAAVLGVTLSSEQMRRANDRAAAAGISRRARFWLMDYRNLNERFDRIVSVGMFEHVGLPNYDAFFGACRERLDERGVMLLHTIGTADQPSLTNPWITRYIFPGGHLPSLSQMLPAIERAGLIVTDVEVLRLHYAHTLRAWRNAFMARRDEARAMFDERFCRMWEFYLAMAETAFRYEKVVVFQIQLARRVDATPIVRDYMIQSSANREAEDSASKIKVS
jgi:cyclopropane-fatty-acyl-phospholipid synthase